MLALGAQAAWLGTRFLLAEEMPIHKDYRRRLIAAGWLPSGILYLHGPVYWSRPGIGSASAARQEGAWKGSAKYWVSWVTRSSAHSMTLTA